MPLRKEKIQEHVSQLENIIENSIPSEVAQKVENYIQYQLMGVDFALIPEDDSELKPNTLYLKINSGQLYYKTFQNPVETQFREGPDDMSRRNVPMPLTKTKNLYELLRAKTLNSITDIEPFKPFLGYVVKEAVWLNKLESINSFDTAGNRQTVLFQLLTQSIILKNWAETYPNEAKKLSQLLAIWHEQNKALSNAANMNSMRNILVEKLLKAASRQMPTSIEMNFSEAPSLVYSFAFVQRMFNDANQFNSRAQMCADLIIDDSVANLIFEPTRNQHIAKYPDGNNRDGLSIYEGCNNAQNKLVVKRIKETMIYALYALEESLLAKDSTLQDLIPILSKYLHNMIDANTTLFDYMDLQRADKNPTRDRENTGTREGIRTHITKIDGTCVRMFLDNAPSVCLPKWLTEVLSPTKASVNTAPNSTAFSLASKQRAKEGIESENDLLAARTPL